MNSKDILLTPIILCAVFAIMGLYLDSDQIPLPTTPTNSINEEQLPELPEVVIPEENPSYDDLPFTEDDWLVYHLEPGSSVDRMLSVQDSTYHEIGTVSLLDILTFSENTFVDNILDKNLEVRLQLVDEDRLLLRVEFIFRQTVNFNVNITI